MSTENKSITFIGAGHLAEAMVAGLVGGGITAEKIMVSNPSGSGLARLSDKFGVRTSNDNVEAVEFADWVFLAVKPGKISELADQIGGSIGDRLLISMAACIPIGFFDGLTAVRILPNIPVAINQGVIGFLANQNVSWKEQHDLKTFLELLGKVIDVKTDAELDLITIVSACGPGIVAYLMNIISEYSVQHGLSEYDASRIVFQTFVGTLAYLNETGLSSQELIKNVATKGGVTETILRFLDDSGAQSILNSSFDAGCDRINIVTNSLT